MKFTNITNLPAPLVRAVTRDRYSKEGARFSVTELIKPVRVRALELKHDDEITVDAADRLWLLVGSVGHEILERAASEEISEKRFHATWTDKKGRSASVSGQMDLLVEKEGTDIIDYKFTSVWTVKDGLKPEWEQQLNLYELLCSEHDIKIRSRWICAIFRDWSVNKAAEGNYPKHQVMMLEVPSWGREKAMEYAQTRLTAHLDAWDAVNGVEGAPPLPECTAEERWEKAASWAVMKVGRQTAVRVFDSQTDAERLAQTLGKGHSAVFRPGISTRCASYCNAAPFCDQFKRLQSSQE